MKLLAPLPAPALDLVDIHGKPIAIGGRGRRTLLSFFRDAACPFCNFRIYQLTSQHENLARLGLDIVAVFTSTPDKVKHFVARQPRPFPVVADPTENAHNSYHIEHSFWGKLKGIVTRIPTLLKGLRFVGLHGLNTTNIMPADFLIDEHGNIAEEHPGMRDVNRHMLMVMAAFSLYAVSLVLRMHDSGLHAPGLLALTTSVCGFVCLAIAGWLGGRLVYGHRLGAE
jgi:peroxiredoxin